MQGCTDFYFIFTIYLFIYFLVFEKSLDDVVYSEVTKISVRLNVERYQRRKRMREREVD